MTHLFVFLEIAASGKRLVAVLARVRVGVVRVGCGRGHGGRGSRDRVVRGRRPVTVVTAMMVDRGTGPAVGGGAAVGRRVVLGHGRTPRRSGLLGAHLARAAQRFCKSNVRRRFNTNSNKKTNKKQRTATIGRLRATRQGHEAPASEHATRCAVRARVWSERRRELCAPHGE